MTASVTVETVLLTGLRAVYFCLCRYYVNLSLFSNLKSVIREDRIELTEDTQEALTMNDVEEGRSLLTSSPSVSPSMNPARGVQAYSAMNQLYITLSTFLFSLAFSESCMLYTLVLGGDLFSEKGSELNWSISLVTLLALIVFVVPFGICLLITHRSQAPSGWRSIMVIMVPFSVYFLFFYWLGSAVASKVVDDGTHDIAWINSLLKRICLPGVVLIAGLSGGGAVNTAWEAFEWRSMNAGEPVSEAQLIAAERSLYRARMDLQMREKAMALAEANAANERPAAAQGGFMSSWTGSSQPATTYLTSLKVEYKSMLSVEEQLARDVSLLKRRRQAYQLSRTPQGRLWLAVGWAFSLYCGFRIILSCINLLVGYKSSSLPSVPPEEQEPFPGNSTSVLPEPTQLLLKRDEVEETPPSPDNGSGNNSNKNRNTAGIDILTSLVSKLALALNLDVDVATYSRLIGLALVGGIITVNMRYVLGSVSRVFRATSTGLSASFMLLFLAELMAVYLLTSLISLPVSEDMNATAAALLNTLPEFHAFSRLFDSVFLFSAGAVLCVRWLHRRISGLFNPVY